MLAAALLPLLLASTATAHFSLTYPEQRGDNDDTQGSSPCGGLDKPSAERTPWSLSGDQLGIKPGHDSANTAVYLAIGNNPTADDFTHVVVPVFLQVGYGTFCWNDLQIPDSAKDLVKAGVNATIQVVQAGHSNGGLYNCADITFTDAKSTAEPCQNVSTSAEPATGGVTDNTGDDEEESAPSSTDTADAAETSTPASGAAGVKALGGLVTAAAIAVGAWML